MLTDSLMTIEESAAALSVRPASVRKWIHQRRLQPVKVGRLTRLRKSDVERVVQHGLPSLAAFVEHAI